MALPHILRQPATHIALAYLAVGGLWILASDSLVELVIGQGFSAGLFQTLKGLLFVAATALLLYWLIRRQTRKGDDRRTIVIEPPRIWMPLATYALFSLGLIFTGLTTFQTQRDQLRASTEAQLRSVGELRINQIDTWLQGLRANASHFGHGSQIAENFEAWIAGGARDLGKRERMLRRMSEIRAAYGYANISLFDTSGEPRLSQRQDPAMMEHRDHALLAMAQRKPVLVDYHQHGKHGSEPMLGMVAPMIMAGGPMPRTVGALFFSIPANTSMVPLIHRWPGLSPSGETLLGRRENNGIRVLYASRMGTTWQLGPLVDSATSRWLLAYARLDGRNFIPDAVDFRHHPVLAYGAAIPDTPWILIAKQDKAEVDALVDNLARVTALVTLFLLAAAGLAFWLWWRSQANRQRAQLLGKELERQVLERRFETLSRYASDVILLTGDNGSILEVNERVEDMYGYTREEILGQPCRMLLQTALQEEFARHWAETLAAGRLNFEAEHRRKDGSCFPVEVSAHVIELNGLRHGHLTIRDVTERKRSEANLRLQTLVLDQIQDHVTITDLDGIITYVNESQCQGSGYAREALIGQFVSIFGNDPNADANQEEIARTTLETGHWQGKLANFRADGSKLYIDLRTSLIRDAAGQPLCMVGVGTDISERLRVEKTLQERESFYRGVIETSADGFWVLDMEGRLLEVNEVYCRRSGYSREELLNMRIGDLDAHEHPEETRQRIRTILESGSNLFETRHRTKDGTAWQVEVNASYSPVNGGRIFVFLRDIQRRSRSEFLLRTRLQLSDLALKTSLEELMQAALDMVELATGSHIGFFHFVDPDQETLALQAWSSNTLKNMCTAEGKGQHYPISQAGVWADAVRAREPLIHNDYASLPDKKGMPEGHAQLTRELVVPILRDGRVVAVLGVGNKATGYTRDDAEVTEQLAAMVMDMVARKQAEAALKQTNLRLIEAQRIAKLGNWDFDVLADRVTWSEQVYAIMGLDPAQSPPSYPEHRRLFHPDDFPRFERDASLALENGTPFQHELRVVRPGGEIRHMWATGHALKNAEGRVVRLFGTVQDITERRQAEAQLEQATHFDALTGLPNTHWLFKRIRNAIDDSASKTLPLLVLNIDRFAQLNESLGRSFGDRVLVALARRWSEILPDGCLLTHLGADQFAVLHEGCQDAARVIETAACLMDAMRQPIQADESDKAVALTLSIGIALHPNDAADAASLLHAAEDALRSAKADKGNQVRFFDRRHAQAAIEWFETETALRQALEREEFFLVYQPQVDAGSGRTIAVEALIRWRHDGQVVPPGRFINVVEGTDLAEPVSRWVLRTACAQARLWLDRQRPLRVAVNVFSDHVTSGHLLDDVRQALECTGLPARLLELEVVESSLLKNPEAASLALREIKRLGVGLALDDFGTGYSSLGYLKHYPFDVLKIDQIFARNVTRDPEDAAIVRSTIALAHSLGMRVLAEGVETEPQLRFMARYGCDQIQGYLLSRPTTPQEVETHVMERRDLRPSGMIHDHKARGILIVDDEPVQTEVLRLLLKDEGYRTFTAENLEGALDIMGRERIDLILCDHYLRDSTGLELLEHIRRLFPDVIRVMVSGTDEQAVVIDAVNRAGIRAWLGKPVLADVLLACLRNLLADPGKSA